MNKRNISTYGSNIQNSSNSFINNNICFIKYKSKKKGKVVTKWGVLDPQNPGKILRSYDKKEDADKSAKVTNVGKATIIVEPVTGSTYWSGQTTTTFNIKYNLTKVTISGIETDYDYTGSAIEPVPTVKFNGEPLDPDKDYKVTYSNNINAGTATLTVEIRRASCRERV